MKKNMACFIVSLAFVFGALSPAFAALGLAQMTTGAAVGQAVLAEANKVYAENSDPDVIQQKLIEILNEAAATGNASSIRYALVAVMMAGVDNPNAFSQNVNAIRASDCAKGYSDLTEGVIRSVSALMQTGSAGGTQQGGGQQQGGGSTSSFLKGLGVDPNNPFTWGSLTGPGDGDVDATRR